MASVPVRPDALDYLAHLWGLRICFGMLFPAMFLCVRLRLQYVRRAATPCAGFGVNSFLERLRGRQRKRTKILL